MSLPSSNWAAQAFQKTFTNVFYSRGVSTRRRRSRRPAQQISLESLEPRQMLAVTSDTDPVTNSTYYSYYQDYRNDANYWVNVTKMGSVSVANGLALWNATGTKAGDPNPGVISETHSYGMILAALYNDKPTFDRLSATVQAGIQHGDGNSQTVSTGLFPWSWVLTAGTSVSPNTSTIYSCSDSNSASDADINLGLAYLYADKAADVYGWSATPSQGGSSYETMATNYIQAIRQHDFSQTDTNLANRYVLAEGAAQATSGFGSNKFHYDYSDPRAYQLFEEYDPFLSANPQSTGESFWATAVTTTSTVWKALFDFGDTDPRVTENANTGAINAATNYVKLSNPTYGTLQAAFSDYTQVQANRSGTAYDSDAQRFPLRLLNYLDAKAAQGQTDSAMYGVAASNLKALGTSYVNANNKLENAVPIADPWSQNGGWIQDYTAAGLLAWAGNDVLQPVNTAAAGIESSLLTAYSNGSWGGSEINDTWTNPYDNNVYAQPGNPDGFNDSLTLWGLTVYDQGRTPLQLHMVQYDPSATVATVPSAPTSVAAVSGNTSLAVTWTAPTSTGGSPITDYLVKYSSNSGSSWTTFADSVSTATSCTVTGLANGTSYVIKVIAKNAVGISLPSANSAPVTPATVPGAPTSVVAVSGNTSLAVTWVAPTSTGGSPITDYLVKYSSNSGSSWTTFADSVSTATSCTVTGLTNGTAYVIKVIAKNAVGISLPSANSALATPATVPGSPTSVTAKSGDAQLTVTWTAPANTGGSKITDYLVKYSSNGGVAGSWKNFVHPVSTVPSLTVTGLTNGISYVVKVIARNEVDFSSPSVYSLPVMPVTIPNVPRYVVAVRGNAQLTVTWTAPTSTGGSAITDYQVKYSSNNGVAGSWRNFIHPVSTDLWCTVTGLTNGTSYVIKVIARNAVGISLPSANSAPVTPALLTMTMVTVGNPGNVADVAPYVGSPLYGAVAYSYQIGKYDVTVSQYTSFLNAVGSTDTYGLYNASMGTNHTYGGIFGIPLTVNDAQIIQSGTAGTYTYAVLNSTGNRPITSVSWFDCARFSNWMSNGQPNGAQTSSTTEDGAYNVNGTTTGNAVAANASNPNTSFPPTYRMPLENEWYKAAYYSTNYGGTGVPGYYVYATQNDSRPGTTIGSSPNQANYFSGISHETDVGAFSGSGSFYGTFDQTGNVQQWNDLDGTAGSSRGLRGGSFLDLPGICRSAFRTSRYPSDRSDMLGFRVARG